MLNPKLVIITPAYNSEKWIASCIGSVISQTYGNIEHFIVDGKSADRTIDVIKSFQAENSQVKYISEKDNGIYDAMNKGIRLSSGNWIYFLGSDDILHDERVVESVLCTDENTSYDFIYGNVAFRGPEEFTNGKYNSFKLIRENICHQSIFYNRRLF
jgi:glycosyltransferase involved in cell wall biosynthesis